jgi:phosphoserine phosphatase
MVGRRPKLVCFDLDGTVTLRPNSLQYLLRLNHAPEHILADIDRREATREVDWIAADYERAPLIAGLPVTAIEENLDAQLVTIENLDLVLDALRDSGILAVLITSGPAEVAQAVARRFTFDHCFGSEFETSGGSDPVYTGRITRHLGSAGKLDCLRELCDALGIALEDCVAVGDGESDLDLFRAVGTSIGINSSCDLTGSVKHQVSGRDLAAVLPFILS